MNKEDWINKILNLKINEKLDLKNCEYCYVKDIKFTQESINSFTNKFSSTFGLFCWIATSENNWRNIYPLENSGDYVKYFKTENGAKRNFIKTYLTKGE